MLQFSFVEPSNYNENLIDERRKVKPVIIEGQSGTSRTDTGKKMMNQLSGDIQIHI